MTLLSLSFGIAYGQDTIRGDSVCTTIEQYKLDNIMITDLLNSRSEQGEIIQLQDKEIITYQMEVQNYEAITSVLSDSLTHYKGELSEINKKLKKSRKIGFIGVLVGVLVGALMH
jgi:predicted RNase H-like nuclease (RuvC/YqgF family)